MTLSGQGAVWGLTLSGQGASLGLPLSGQVAGFGLLLPVAIFGCLLEAEIAAGLGRSTGEPIPGQGVAGPWLRCPEPLLVVAGKWVVTFRRVVPVF